MTTTTQRITSTGLNYKRIAKYFHKCGTNVYVERLDTGEFLLTDKLVMVRVSMAHPDLAPYTEFHPDCKRVVFENGKAPAAETQYPDQQKFWDQFENSLMGHPLTLTHELHEVPGDKKGGTLYRKFTFEDAQQVQRVSYFNKQILDMFSPDLDELEGFGFEQVGHHGPMRVSAVFGYVAIVMPGHNIASR